MNQILERQDMRTPDASEVFLIMGQRGEQGEIAIVIAEDARSAVQHFEGAYPGTHAVLWPSLADIADTVRLMQRAQRGESPAAPGEDPMVVLHGLGFVPQTLRRDTGR